MAFKSVAQTIVMAMALGATAVAVPAFAQRGQEEELKKAENAAKAAQNAKMLEADEKAHGPMKLPAASVAADPANIWDLDLSTGGRVRIQLRPDVAPDTVERIKTLTRQGFYNGLKFHRVIDGFMAQGGDPKGDGTGGSTLPDLHQEFNALPHVRGAVSMARAQDENSANSQFFIVMYPRLQLDNKYTVFGRVIDGMQYVDAIHRGEPPADPTVIVQASIDADGTPVPTNLSAPMPAAANPNISVDDLNKPLGN